LPSTAADAGWTDDALEAKTWPSGATLSRSSGSTTGVSADPMYDCSARSSLTMYWRRSQ